MSEKLDNLVPPILGVANIHPDYIRICTDLCCTGTSTGCKFPPGTISLIRQTSSRGGKENYGVAGIWSFSGTVEPVLRRERFWPSRWDKKVLFQPLVREFTKVWCEDFSVRPSTGGHHNESPYVPGLTYIKLQGSLIRVADAAVAKRYIDALLQHRREELSMEVDYLGRRARVSRLLQILRDKLPLPVTP